MLIVVVSVFLLVEIPMAIATLIHLLVNLGIIHFQDDSHLPYTKLTILLCNFIIMLSFPLNFAIYCGMSAQFRNTFKALFASNLFSQWHSGSQSILPQDNNTVSLAIVGDGASTVPANVRRTSSAANKTMIKSKQNGNTFVS